MPTTGLDASDVLDRLTADGAPSASTDPSLYASAGRVFLDALRETCTGASRDDAEHAIAAALATLATDATGVRMQVGCLYLTDKEASGGYFTALTAALSTPGGASKGAVNTLLKGIREAASFAGGAIDDARRRHAESRRKRNAQGAGGIPVLTKGETPKAEAIRVCRQVIANHPDLYIRGSDIVGVTVPPGGPLDPELPPIIQPLSADMVEAYLNESVLFYAAEGVEDFAWGACVRGVMGQLQPAGRYLAAVIQCPTIRDDGSPLTAEGYDEATGLLHLPRRKLHLKLPPPSLDAAHSALGRLIGLVREFPFADMDEEMRGPSLSAWLALVLTLSCRPAIPGLVPMWLHTASTRGSGKTKLADLAHLIATGATFPRQPESESEAETRKNLMGRLMAGQTAVLMDNLTGGIGGPTLDALLTAPVMTDRPLGASKIGAWVNRLLIVASGNNLQIVGDGARRTVVVDLRPEVEHPEDQAHAIADIEGHVRQHQAEYLAAALTIVRSYICAGEPLGNIPFGSFDGWSRRIRGALLWLDCADPVVKRQDMDPETAALHRFLGAWWGQFRDLEQRTGDVRSVLEDRSGDMGDALAELYGALDEMGFMGRGRLNVQKLGKYLSQNVDRIVGGRRLERTGRSRGSSVWRVVERG